MNTRRIDAVSLALIGLASAITGGVYARLPQQVPVHFSFRGEPNSWMDKPVGAWLLLGTALLVWGVVRFGGCILPNTARVRMEASPTALVGLLTVALFVGLQLLILFAALEGSRSIGKALGILFGVYWLVLAQVLPRVRRNPFIGIRTAWTLGSDENWARTHRFGALAFTIGGIVAVLAALASLPAVAIGAIVLSALAPLAFSVIVAHQLPPEA